MQRPVIDDASMTMPRRQIWFYDPDQAYLVAAALARHLDASGVSDVILVPTSHVPALDASSTAASDRLVLALVRRFGGHIDAEAVAQRLRRMTG